MFVVLLISMILAILIPSLIYAVCTGRYRHIVVATVALAVIVGGYIALAKIDPISYQLLLTLPQIQI